MSKISGFLALVLVATFSLAYTQASAEYVPGGDMVEEDYVSSAASESPFFVLDKHSSDHRYNELTFYLSFGDVRYRYKMRAGSGGAGTNDPADSMDECNVYDETNDPAPEGGGWLPDGTYTISNYFVYKNTGDMRGPAWDIGDHVCSDGSTVREDLFIHSKSPWSSSSYESFGCIKISWNDATVLMGLYEMASKPTLGGGKVVR